MRVQGVGCVEEGAGSVKEQRVRVKEDGGWFEDGMAAVMRTYSVDAVYRMLRAARSSFRGHRRELDRGRVLLAVAGLLA